MHQVSFLESITLDLCTAEQWHASLFFYFVSQSGGLVTSLQVLLARQVGFRAIYGI